MDVQFRALPPEEAREMPRLHPGDGATLPPFFRMVLPDDRGGLPCHGTIDAAFAAERDYSP